MSMECISPPIVRLEYAAGEQIFKAGDYGTCVYKILEGKVALVAFANGREKVVTTLTEGDVIGEVALIGRSHKEHSCSARAVVPTAVEVWHVAWLTDEIDKAPALLRQVLRQPMQRLLRTRRLLDQLGAKTVFHAEAEVKSADEACPAPEDKSQWARQQRRHYRKTMEREAVYRPVGASEKVVLKGVVRDVSRGGMGMEVGTLNLQYQSHDIGDEFDVDLVLPDGKDIHFVAKLLHIKRTTDPEKRFLGMMITMIGYESQKRLGFFLMP
jgi:CRP-like cAMP-binding protein